MYKGAIFFDYDGTLTDENAGIYYPTPKTIDSLEKLRANGYATFLATGRMKPLTALVSGKFLGLVTSNGSYAEVDGKPVQNLYIDSRLLSEAIDYMIEHGICYALETQRCAYTNGLKNKHFLEVLDHFKLAKSLFRPHERNMAIQANKMFISYESNDLARDMAERFRGRLSLKPHRFCMSADVDAENISKAVGIKSIIDYLGIPKEKTYAFGDGSNDLTMFQAVAHPVAMGDHSSALDGAAEFYTETVKNEGIYKALHEHYSLI